MFTFPEHAVRLKNRGPLLADKVRATLTGLPGLAPGGRGWRSDREAAEGIDAKIEDLDPVALDGELKQEVTGTQRYGPGSNSWEAA